MSEVRFYFVPVNPEQWALGPAGISNRGGTKRPFIAPNEQMVTYQKAVRNALLAELSGTDTLIDYDCQLTLYFWRRLDRYLTGSERKHARHVADATNMQKALEDALQGVIITNDRLVKRIASEIVAQDHDVDPGILFVVEPYSPGWAKLPSEFTKAIDARRAEAGKVSLGDENDW